MNKNLILLLTILFSANTFACRMTSAALNKKSALEAIKSINNINEVVKKVEVEGTMANVTFLREIVGSVFCVEKEMNFSITADCAFEIGSEKEIFIEAQDCEYLK